MVSWKRSSDAHKNCLIRTQLHLFARGLAVVLDWAFLGLSVSPNYLFGL